MKKNRIIAAIWLTVISLIIVAIIGYVIYAAIENPYFVTKDMVTIRDFSTATLRIFNRGVA